MNKATAKKLMKLHRLFMKYEEAVERNFTKKQVAIAKYRMGYNEGEEVPNRLHELAETAKHFKCSVSYVTKIMRDVTDFCNEMEKTAKKAGGKNRSPKRVIASGVIEKGVMNARHETEGDVHMVIAGGRVDNGFLVNVPGVSKTTDVLAQDQKIKVDILNMSTVLFEKVIHRLFFNSQLWDLKRDVIDNSIRHKNKQTNRTVTMALLLWLLGIGIIMGSSFFGLEGVRQTVAEVLGFIIIAGSLFGWFKATYQLGETRGMIRVRKKLVS